MREAKLFDRLLIGKNLSARHSKRIFGALFASGNSHAGQLLLGLLQKKGVHPDELSGLVRLVRQHERPITKQRLPYLVDGCGTGGDGKQTFNISTTACLVAAGAGAPVAKHGNYGVTSRSGSSDLMTALGVRIDAPPARMIRALTAGGFGYFHAPFYHRRFRNVQPVRTALARKGIKTIFNLVGPLVNPVRPARQVIGVADKTHAAVVAEALKRLKIRRALVVWNLDGFDEFTTTANTLCYEVNRGKLTVYVVAPASVGLPRSAKKSLRGGSPALNASITRRILEGTERGVKRDTVLLNAGAVLYASGKAKNLRDGVRQARNALDRGLGRAALEKLIAFSHGSG